MIYDKAMIRDIQMENNKSLKKLDEICRKHKIPYWIMYGTLIGAVRNGGCIPWDDDIDVGMMWEDFKKLCELPAEEWGEECLFLAGESDDTRHDKVFGRVYQKKSVVQSYVDVENWIDPSTGKAWATMCMCDIFIFDYAPQDQSKHKKIYDKLRRSSGQYKFLKLEPANSGKGIKEFVRREWRRIEYKKSDRPWLKIYNQFRPEIEKYPMERSTVCTYYCADPVIYQTADIFPLIEMPYEDMKVFAPRNYDSVLRAYYGDYMVPPPEVDRYHLSLVYAKLGSGKEYVIDPIPGSIGAR